MKGGPALSADEHRAALGGCEIAWEVMETTIRIHPQTLRIDTSGDALDGVCHLFRRLSSVALHITRTSNNWVHCLTKI